MSYPKQSQPEPRFLPEDIPVPADLRRHYLEQPLPELFENIDEGLFNLRFLKLKKGRIEKERDTARLLEQLKVEIISNMLIKARGVYQFVQVDSSGEEIRFYNADGLNSTGFVFPRQAGGERLCLADFVAPAAGGRRDYAALFAVTCGEGVAELSGKERAAGNYVRSYLLEAFALALAEAFAEVVHYHIRKEWGIAEAIPARPLLRGKYRGKRYSFGYPACPDLAGQKNLFSLLSPETDAGIKLTDDFMMDPEASVSAIVLHNPKAQHFSVLSAS